MNEFVEKARNLGLSIQKSEEFLNFVSLKESFEKNEEITKLNKEFELKRDNLNLEMSKEEPDREIIQNISEELRMIYDKIHKNESMISYQLAKSSFDNLLSEITSTLTSAAYGEFSSVFPGTNCLGSCSECSGC